MFTLLWYLGSRLGRVALGFDELIFPFFFLFFLEDMRDYTFQAHFCERIYQTHHRFCRPDSDELAFTLRQVGYYLGLSRIFCRCEGVAEVHSYSYSRPVNADDRLFRPRFIQMTCKRPVS
ncbi:unnamed protein product [Protopolystoma xenopodis]|uniref:DUF5731 domain-containing protein n=1 Tax=Protopolystoma xenopodis TaxID=117903 RepID=A0A448XHU0_9PLAT|nr:unnamed protein product [Protopolystoma xenopodis]